MVYHSTIWYRVYLSKRLTWMRRTFHKPANQNVRFCYSLLSVSSVPPQSWNLILKKKFWPAKVISQHSDCLVIHSDHGSYIYFIIILLWIWTTCNRSIWRERWRFHFLDHMVLRLLMPLMVTFALFCCKYFPKGEVGKIGWGFPHRRVYMYTYGCKLHFLNFPWFEGSRSKTITELIPENS